MQIVLNGRREELPGPLSVAELLARKGLEESHVVVEVDGEMVKQETWSEFIIQGDAQVEILHFVGGG
ncbi:MAG: sulfur carrier protein ThiS [Limnochordia bacterium]|jgi:thiamine biosynthesis protein ThiS